MVRGEDKANVERIEDIPLWRKTYSFFVVVVVILIFYSEYSTVKKKETRKSLSGSSIIHYNEIKVEREGAR